VRPPLQLGRCVSTPAALIELERAGIQPALLLGRQRQHDWGTLSPDDRRANERALIDGSRVFSVYVLPTGQRIWCITEGINDEGERESTCLLLPSEY
jgi:hypothetical protein